jgi:hypothetical protein
MEINIEEAQKQSGVSASHLRRLCRDGVITAHRVTARVYMVDVDSLTTFIKNRPRRGPKPHKKTEV